VSDVLVDDWVARLRSRVATTVSKPNLVSKEPRSLQTDLPLPKVSCGYPAGSIEKIEVMRARAASGEALFHPHDNREILVRQSHCARVG
jgi:hypothetical protein